MEVRELLYNYSWCAWLLIHLGLSWFYSPHFSDDSFIFFRYAENWGNGYGPVWNMGESVEGFSSPLWLYILSLGHAIGIYVPNLAKLLGLLFGFGAVYLVGQLAKHIGVYEHRGWLMCGASLTVGLHYWSPAGLETSLYCFLWCASLLALVENKWLWAVALLGLARPEGLLILFFWCVGDWLLSQRFRWRNYIWIVLPSVGWLTFRMYFYEIEDS